MRGKHDNKEVHLNGAHSFPRVLGYKRGNDITEVLPPSHPTLPNNQSLSLKLGKALSVIAEASNYPNAPTRTCSRDF